MVWLIAADELQARIAELAQEIDADYADTGLVLLCVLKSAAVFAADLLRQLRCPVHHMEFLRARSYGAGTESAGAVQVQSLLEERHIAGGHILIVDDIADSGHSCLAVTRYIRAMEPASMPLLYAAGQAGTPRGVHRLPLCRLHHPQPLRGGLRHGSGGKLPAAAGHLLLPQGVAA